MKRVHIVILMFLLTMSIVAGQIVMVHKKLADYDTFTIEMNSTGVIKTYYKQDKIIYRYSYPYDDYEIVYRYKPSVKLLYDSTGEHIRLISKRI